MIAYNTTWLYNLLIRDQADEASNRHCITGGENERIFTTHAVNFYTPNFFVRIGLFILTVVIALFTLGLFLLAFLSGNDNQIGGLMIFLGVLAYISLEVMVAKRHYKSGVDDALLWIAPASIVAGFNIMATISYMENAIIIFILSLFLFIRFINMVIAGIAGIAFISVLFLAFIKLGESAKATAPFVVMITSALLYLFATKMLKKEKYKFYFNGLLLISIIALTGFYIAGNYFVVRETSIAMFNLDLQEGQAIPLGWLFWILTFIIPVIYIARGIQKKDVVLLRVGLALIAAMIFTVRYYYHVMPAETAAVIGGVSLIAISYALIRYLREPKYGFTYKKEDDPMMMEKLQIESLIIAETLPVVQQPADKGFQFGGGSGGGAGASGEF